MYTLRQAPYCGLSMPAKHYDERHEARDAAAAILARRRRQGYKIATLEPGAEWEILEPEGCAMVPDACGLVSLARVTFECRECGSAWDTKGDAAACCVECDA